MTFYLFIYVNLQTTPCPSPTHPHQWESNLLEDPSGRETLGESKDVAQHHHRTSLVVRFQGDVDVMITPLALESLQR